MASPYYRHAALPMKFVGSWPAHSYGENFASKSNSELGGFDVGAIVGTIQQNPLLAVGAVAAAYFLFFKKR